MNRIPGRGLLVFIVSGLLLFAVGCRGGGDQGSAGSELTTGLPGVAKAQSAPVDSSFGGRDGQEDPRIITTLEELQAMRDELGGHYALGADIDASATESWGPYGFEPIGSEDAPFTGSLDGRGHTISGLYIQREHDSHVGLFGYTAMEAQITGVGLVDARIAGLSDTGALVGHNRGNIWNSYSENGLVSGSQGVGGLVGETVSSDTADGSITGSYSSGTVDGGSNTGGLIGSSLSARIGASHSAGVVNGTTYLGGLVGWQDDGSITGSYSTADVTGTGPRVGGLVGSAGGSITTSHSAGAVTGTENTGGLAGYNSGSLTRSYSLGSVTGTRVVGGLVGHNAGSIEDTYSLGDVSGTTTVGGLVGSNQGDGSQRSYSSGVVVGEDGVGGLTGFNAAVFRQSYWDADMAELLEPDNTVGNERSSAEMFQEATFEEWDFGSVWTIAEGVDYPDLLENSRQ